MLAASHNQAATEIETSIAGLTQDPGAARIVTEGSWGAAFHWIAFGTQSKHGQHQDSHARLATSLRTLGEPAVATWWEQLERLRRGGWYGMQTHAANVQEAQEMLRNIRTWATT